MGEILLTYTPLVHSLRGDKTGEPYVVCSAAQCDAYLKAYVPYCTSTDVLERDSKGRKAWCGTLVYGTRTDADWIKVDDGLFLPLCFKGAPALRLATIKEIKCADRHAQELIIMSKLNFWASVSGSLNFACAPFAFYLAYYHWYTCVYIFIVLQILIGGLLQLKMYKLILKEFKNYSHYAAVFKELRATMTFGYYFGYDTYCTYFMIPCLSAGTFEFLSTLGEYMDPTMDSANAGQSFYLMELPFSACHTFNMTRAEMFAESFKSFPIISRLGIAWVLTILFLIAYVMQALSFYLNIRWHRTESHDAWPLVLENEVASLTQELGSDLSEDDGERDQPDPSSEISFTDRAESSSREITGDVDADESQSDVAAKALPLKRDMTFGQIYDNLDDEKYVRVKCQISARRDAWVILVEAADASSLMFIAEAAAMLAEADGAERGRLTNRLTNTQIATPAKRSSKFLTKMFLEACPSLWFNVSLFALAYGGHSNWQSLMISFFSIFTSLVVICHSIILKIRYVIAVHAVLYADPAVAPVFRQHLSELLACGLPAVFIILATIPRLAGVWMCECQIFNLSSLSCVVPD